jgi:hypothetical protein
MDGEDVRRMATSLARAQARPTQTREEATSSSRR